MIQKISRFRVAFFALALLFTTHFASAQAESTTWRFSNMEMNTTARSNPSVLIRMEAAINARDINALVNCFTHDFVSEQPVHPERNFIGAEHVRKNWTGIFAQVPDIRAKLVTYTIAGDIGWSEWHWQGNQIDGTEFNMRGAIVVGLRENAIAWARLYMEPVQRLPN